MKIGVSTGCFFPRQTVNALETVALTGAKYTEIFFNTDSELDEEYVYSLKNIADANGIQVVSVHPFTSAIETFMFWAKSDYKLSDSIKYYEKYFRACQILGTKYVVIHGCHISSEYMTMKKYTEILNLLSRKAREYGVYICQENVVKFKCGYIDNLIELKKYADSEIKFVFDIKQAVRAGQDIYSLIDIMGDRISHVHISDFNDSRNSLLPGQGIFDYGEMFEYISGKYDVEFALIEVYNENITEDYGLSQSLDLLKNIV